MIPIAGMGSVNISKKIVIERNGLNDDDNNERNSEKGYGTCPK